jgi:hypothetical protein
MDVFYHSFAQSGYDVKYITGLNRDNCRKLESRGKLEGWLRSIGVRDGDILIDSGFRGSIFSRIATSTTLKLYYNLLSMDEGAMEGIGLIDWRINTPKSRRVILALEHSPKTEVVSWDGACRRPKINKLNGAELERARSFLKGCVSSLRESIRRYEKMR